ncbi:hypothetical protein QF046_002550 [Microbacterium sp. W4I4]|uniref:hypothetical protein n=1 Tax=Microbacterium sp. W4I4 TaxID=3042295 RepID=UPI002780529C|nr:hypothetical protein [Microbacterium sp. W4I4]MDQ0614909.1 hypothetical protein [Microbacterium sp. W4I4]
MSIGIRVLLLAIGGVSAAVIAVLTLLRLLAPDFAPEAAMLLPSLVGRVGGPAVDAAVTLTAALGALAVFVISAAVPRSERLPAGIRFAVVLAAALLALVTPGGVIAAAGYTFALLVVVGIVVLIVLLVLRRPWIGLPLALVMAVLIGIAVTSLKATELVPAIFGALEEILPRMLMALAHLAGAVALLIPVIIDSRRTRGRFARGVQRHRVAITVLAAMCALPYVIARASWLTPWPLFGGSANMLSTQPEVLLTGLLLALGMLVGGVLTLGLVLPWGERFPRWLVGLGGRPVPLALVVVPASIVSVLFTVGGVEMAFFSVGGTVEAASVVLLLAVLPFWLWGPLLGLATWAYAMKRMASDLDVRARLSIR